MSTPAGSLPGDRKPAQAPKALNLLLGTADDGFATLRVRDDAQSVDYILRGGIDLTPALSPGRFTPRLLYVQPGRNMQIGLGPGPIVNMTAEPDLCSQALQKITEIVASSGRPCFNHPLAITATTRDQVSRSLAGMPGLVVPKTVRVSARSGAELHLAMQENALAFPVLVRSTGTHGGSDMLRADAPEQLDSFFSADSGRLSVYLTEFHDFASPDGLYRKYRIAVVGDEIFLRHVYIGADWLVHRVRRAPDTESQEAAALIRFDSGHAARLRPLLQDVARRLRLDFFGVDCSLAESGELLLFEANAQMRILHNGDPSPSLWDAPIARIRAAVAARLATPRRWRCAKRAIVRRWS